MNGTLPVPGLVEASALIAAGKLSSRELTRMTLARIAALDGDLHAFIAVTEQSALAEAAAADDEIRAGQSRGPLHGIPFALKDNIDAAGVATTAHSRLRMNAVAARDSGVAQRLKHAGMILVGKQSLHEFARGGPTDTLPWPNAVSPWNRTHACGGSSSGGAVAVASGMVALSVGTDTGGSIRFPAACNGIVGLKPTYGLISRRGVVPLSFSLDAVGPLTRTVADAALATAALAGFDVEDPGSARASPADYAKDLGLGVRGLRIGLLRDYDTESRVGGEQAAAMAATAAVLEGLGATVAEVRLPPRILFDAATWTIMLAEGFAIHGKDLRERPMDYGRTARERLSIGAFVTGAHYVQAQRHRAGLTRAVDRALDGFDALLCASANGPPPPLAAVDDGPWRKQHPITAPFNLTGHPAIALPVGFGAGGLPLSAQFIGRCFGEAMLFRIAHAVEQATPWHDRRPPV